MKLVASLSMVHSRGACRPWWPEGAERLIVIVLEPEPLAGVLLGYGVAPSGRRSRTRIAFEARLGGGDLGGFLREVVDGDLLSDGSSDIQVIDRRQFAARLTVNPDLPPATRNLVLTLAGALDGCRVRADARARRVPPST